MELSHRESKLSRNATGLPHRKPKVNTGGRCASKAGLGNSQNGNASPNRAVCKRHVRGYRAAYCGRLSKLGNTDQLLRRYGEDREFLLIFFVKKKPW